MKLISTVVALNPRPGRAVIARRRPSVVFGLLTALALALLPLPARADDDVARASARSTLTYSESGCTEIGYQRGGLASAVRPLVPERFALADYPGLPEGSPARVYLLVNEVTCDRGRFAGESGNRSHYTYLIVSALVTATEGHQRDGAYVLFYVTENRAQRAALRRLGWPVTSLSSRTTSLLTRDTTGTPLGSALHVVGGGWDHDLAAVASGPRPSAERSASEYYRDTPRGAQTACFDNLTSVSAASFSGDLRGTPLATIAYVPPLFTGYPGGLVVGGWDVTVTTGSCPASTAPALEVPQQRSGTASGADQQTE